MPNQPVTINIVPSDWQRRSSLAVAVITCLLVAVYGPLWLVVMAILGFVAASLRERRKRRAWQLRWVPGKEGGWQRREGQSDAWCNVSLHHTYLGPWLIGLNVAGNHYWIWPDSANAQARQALRRVLIWSAS